MKATRVSIRAGRRPGITITFILLLFTMFRSAKASEVIATITGVLSGGYDRFPMFGVGTKYRDSHVWDISKQPFTLVFTFDDSKGRKTHGSCDPKAASGVEGGGTQSPGKAVLTIAGVSYTFPGAGSSGAWREVPTACSSDSAIYFHVSEMKAFFDFAPGVDVKIVPAPGKRSITDNPDWEAPLSITAIDNQTSCFYISRPNDNGHEAKGCFDVKKLEIKKR